ncbi:MAG: hypothetical protein QG662_2051 [Pseudomonadota bacterium]|nr:hypothetical protein [Pseudomonadota bacterium]
MAADQAAGLRRRRGRQPLRCIHCFFDSVESTRNLARALHRRGWTSLLVDPLGRACADAPARSLFDWRQQLARGQLHTVPLPCCDGWHAPGVRADEPGLGDVAQNYDCLVFDADANAPEWAPMPGAAQTLVIEANAAHASLLRAYALIKTLARLPGASGNVVLLGDAAACDRLRAACERFLDPSFGPCIHSVAHEDDAFSALAVRMADAEIESRDPS